MKPLLLTVAAALLGMGMPYMAQAQSSDALSSTAQAVKELTDHPGQGKRTLADMNTLGGADVGQMGKAAGLFQEALDKAKSGGADQKAINQLEMAYKYAKAREHKEARLSGEGALFYLCKQNNGEPKDTCDKTPKFGSYVAP
ncbi:MAG: hypothetical protein ACKOCD_06090 [Nitrospiraceae bacterium]